jgi:hypothetical protein
MKGKLLHMPGSFLGWAAGVLVLAGIWLVLELFSPDQVAAWSGIYLAGAVGGLALEFMRNAWRFEGPSASEPGEGADPSFAPYGPLTDLGFLGRMLTGAIAAPTFIVLVNAVDASSGDLTDQLTAIASRTDTYAWAVAVGFASPAVWTLIEGFVKNRAKVAELQMESQVKTAELETVRQQAALAKEQVERDKTTAAAVTLGNIVAAPSVEGSHNGAPTDGEVDKKAVEESLGDGGA